MRVAAVLRRVHARQPPPADRCGLCSAPLAERHPHVVDLRERRLECACGPCAVLFRSGGAGQLRTVPDRVRHDPALDVDGAALAALGIPVRLAFVFEHSGIGGPVCLYPGPAGTVEATPDPAAWASLRARSSLLARATPDVEALLFAGAQDGRSVEVFLVGIDRCYELAGILRRSWRGFEGGAEARQAISAFLADLRASSRALRESER